MYNFRTDLALERNDILKKENNLQNIEGVETEEKRIDENLLVSKVKIVNKNGEEAIGKPAGNYITIDLNKFNIATEEEIDKYAECLANEIKELVSSYVKDVEDILVVGLGNEYVTPDALGPKVTKDIEVTRHLLKYMPEYVKPGTRPISAIAPGVLGTTGIETLEILKGIVDNTKPKLLIVIDSLASRNIKRISSTIQLADTGIVPGAGVGNTRKELSKQTLGIPVIAIGIPTVVDLATIADDCLDLFITKLQEDAKSNEYLNNLKEQSNYEKIKETLNIGDYNMIVTPKEIDKLIDNMSLVVSKGINYSI